MIKINKQIIYSLVLLLVLNSCSLIHFLSFKDQGIETPVAYTKFLLQNGIDTTFSFQLSPEYYDSLSTKKYALNLYKTTHNSHASPIQIRFYSNEGKLLNGWEQCFGEITKFPLLDSVPMKKVSHLPINYDLNLNNDLNLLNISSSKRKLIMVQSKKYDYTIIAMYSIWSGWYSKHALKVVNKYINENGKEKILFIKMNTSPCVKLKK
jgi:hypothetical protein